MSADPKPLRSPWLWPTIAAGCIVVGLLDAFRTAMEGLLGDQHAISWPHVIFQTSEWLFLGILSPITYHLGKRYPLRRPRLRKALLIHSLGALLLCIGWAFLGVAGRQLLGIGWGIPVAQEMVAWTLISLPWSFLLYFALLGVFTAFIYDQQVRESTQQLSDARLRVLRAQLQPHFLFNALNAVNVLVRDNRNAVAVAVIDKLSDMLRYLLRVDLPHEIALREEIHLVRQYLEIEQVRFSDRLRVEYEIESDTLDAAVPSLILQPLVENAVRHGIADRLDNAIIQIGARRAGDTLELWVRDNGRGLDDRSTAGIGLNNTLQRLSTLYGARGVLRLEPHPDAGTIAYITLPWRMIE